MKNRLLWKTLFVAATLAAAACSNDGEDAVTKFEVNTGAEAGAPVFVVPGRETTLSFTGEHITTVTTESLPEGWEAEVRQTEGIIALHATDDAQTSATLRITAAGSGANKVVCEVALRCLNSFDDPAGTFVLNEGNMTTENGSLTYISPEGYVFDDAYRTVNGSELGNVAQDMAFCDGKIYVISQNGNRNANGAEFENDGMLVVMDARTLRRTASFSNEELAGLDWPTHIAVLDERHIYIRDNAGVHRLDGETGTLTFVEGSEDAPKSRFVTMNGKVYTYLSGYISKIYEISPESDAVNSIRLPLTGIECDINEVLGIQAADDGRMWIMTFGFGKTAMNKFDLSTQDIVQRQINIKPTAGASGVAFAAHDNLVYYADGTIIYRLPFDESAELDAASGLDAVELLTDVSGLDPNAGQLYNGLGVHPATGHLYINSIKSYAQFTQNQIWEFDPAGDFLSPLAKYENYTNFPAGFFFPEAR